MGTRSGSLPATRAAPRSRRGRRIAVEILVAIVAGLAVAVTLDVVRSGGPDGWLASRGLGPPYDAQGRLIEVDGVGMYLDCRGSGHVTVVLESGLGTGADGWGFVLPRLAERTRVCAYDRAGIGRSEAAERRTIGEEAAALHALLEAAGERPPWVLVGHSLGGVYARIFAARERRDVVGVVLVDAYIPDGRWLDGLDLDPAMLADWAMGPAQTAGWIEATENVDWERSLEELALASLDGLPVEVLAVDQHLRYDDPRLDAATEERIIAAWERWMMALSPGSTRVTISERSTHLIQLNRPDLVVEAVERLLPAP